MLHHIYLSVYLFVLSTNVSFAQITNWQVDPTNTTQYQVPYGWEVNVGQDQGVYLWQALEDPANPLGADITVLTMSDFAGSSPAFFIDRLSSTIQSFQLVETKQISADEYHYRAKGQMEGQKVSSNLIFLRDRNAQLIYIASFSALERDYAALGGTAVLYQSLQRLNPFSNGTEPAGVDTYDVGTGSDAWNMQSVEIQNALKAQGMTPEKQMLIGKWMQAFSYQTGTASQDIFSGQIAYGERGYGHLLTFKADNTYTLTYKYNSVSQGCKYQADFFESGRYKMEGRQLVLYPNGYEGSYNVCDKINPERKTSLPTRYFEVYIDQEGKRLVIVGQAMEYSISYETDVNGQNHIQEGFNKTR
ncbi:MAG: lipocalin family protein [Bacteroidota bacterium]